MTQPGFESMSSAQLEELLRSQDLSPADRRAVQAELGRRIAGNLTGLPAPPPATPAPSPAPPPKSPVPPPHGITHQRAYQPAPTRPPAPPQYGQVPGSPGRGMPPPARPRQDRARKSPVGKVIAVIAIVAAIVAVVVYFLVSSDDDGPTPSETGYTCFVSAGSCPLAQGLPVGTSCECVDDFGGTYVGTVG